jgi:hypothetical protein
MLKRTCSLAIAVALFGCTQEADRPVIVTLQIAEPLSHADGKAKIQPLLRRFIVPISTGPECSNITFEPVVRVRRYDLNETKTAELGALTGISNARDGVDGFLGMKVQGPELDKRIGLAIEAWKIPEWANVPSRAAWDGELEVEIFKTKPEALIVISSDISERGKFVTKYRKIAGEQAPVIIESTPDGSDVAKEVGAALCASLKKRSEKPAEVAFILLRTSSAAPTEPAKVEAQPIVPNQTVKKPATPPASTPAVVAPIAPKIKGAIQSTAPRTPALDQGAAKVSVPPQKEDCMPGTGGCDKFNTSVPPTLKTK